MSVSNETMDRILERMTDEQIASHVIKCWDYLGEEAAASVIVRLYKTDGNFAECVDDVASMDENNIHVPTPTPTELPPITETIQKMFNLPRETREKAEREEKK